MKNGFILTDGKEIEFAGTGQLSIGEGMQLDNRFSYDYSKKPQSITRRKRKTARAATLTMQVARNVLLQEQNLFEYVECFEQVCGKSGDLYWNGRREGAFCVRGVSFSFAVDAVDIATAVQISIELTESYTKKQTGNRNIKIRHF